MQLDHTKIESTVLDCPIALLATTPGTLENGRKQRALADLRSVSTFRFGSFGRSNRPRSLNALGFTQLAALDLAGRGHR